MSTNIKKIKTDAINPGKSNGIGESIHLSGTHDVKSCQSVVMSRLRHMTTEVASVRTMDTEKLDRSPIVL